MPELPAFGMRFVMPTKADGFVYEGLSGETYPDRKAGGIHGIYEVEAAAGKKNGTLYLWSGPWCRRNRQLGI